MSNDAEHYSLIDAILSKARLLEGAELEAFLDAKCGEDQALRSEVRKLLAAGHDARSGAPFADEQLDSVRASLEGVVASAAREWLPERIGDYRVLRQIGRGGMGVVYEAEQSSPRRRVAIKLLDPFQATGEKLRRFEQEAKVLGQLQHPGIARIYEAGTFDAGRGPQPFFTMELVEGVDLRTHCESEGLGRAERLELLAKVADTLQYAHDRGIVHRDLKPDNVLVDAAGEPRVLDFGIAHAGGDSTVLSTALTKEGQLVGTLAYMSPEQLGDEHGPITPSVDVFAMGVMGFELLTGRSPRDMGEGSLPQMIARLARSQPLRASAVDSTCEGDVDTILGKALELEAERRYESVGALAKDIRLHLANQPIYAHPPSVTYVMRKFVRRNWALVAGAVATLAVGGVALGAWLTASERAMEIEARDSDIQRLATAADYEDLMARADALWAPLPARKSEFTAWIEDAQRLVSELPSLSARRDELRAMALPRTAAERDAERLSHPDHDELERVSAQLEVLRGAMAQRVDGIAVELPEVDWAAQPGDSDGLLAIARPMIHPARHTYGDEGLALLLAERALELAPPDGRTRWTAAMTIAMANFELGRDDEAVAVIQEVTNEVDGEARAARGRALAELTRVAKSINTPEGIEAEWGRVEELAATERELAERVDERRSWNRFPPEVEAAERPRWWLEQLDESIAELESLTAEGGLLDEDGVGEESGWSMPMRLAFAEHLEVGFGPDGEYTRRWEEELPHLRDAYPDLELASQLGLVPLGPDPSSGLHEFWHVQSGDEPVRGEDGALRVEPESGLVLVLLPGGMYRMGAQTDPREWNDDPHAQPDEGKVREVQLSAFFLSKYEMTQAQWTRSAGRDPSHWTAETSPEARVEGVHPVEQITWTESAALLERLGLVLPSEAQWEYACRAGSDAPRPFPDEALAAHANLADSGAATGDDDGFAVPAPVGSLAPNGFGLHDMIGNVAEWCLDDYDPGYYRESSPVNPVNSVAPANPAVHRGGSSSSSANAARASSRHSAPRVSADAYVGVRPVRTLTR